MSTRSFHVGKRKRRRRSKRGRDHQLHALRAGGRPDAPQAALLDARRRVRYERRRREEEAASSRMWRRVVSGFMDRLRRSGHRGG